MRTLASFVIVVVLFMSPDPSAAQPQSSRHIDLELEPLAYAFGGAGGHVGLQVGHWKYEVEAFGLEIPAALHGNDAFTARTRGAELHAEYRFGDGPGGFYAGPEAGLTRLTLTHDSGARERRTTYSVGVRGGYRWYTGLGNLYVSPVVGVSYSLNADDVSLAGDTFETSSLGPWGTIGIGWSLSR